MVTDGNYVYFVEHCIMYRNTESLFCVLETNTALYFNYTSIIKNFEKKSLCQLQYV